MNLLDSYLNTVNDIIDWQRRNLGAYSDNVSLGCFVKGVIEEVRTNHAIIRTEDGDLGLVKGKFTKGQEVTGSIAWIDVTEQMIHVVENANLQKNDLLGQ